MVADIIRRKNMKLGYFKSTPTQITYFNFLPSEIQSEINRIINLFPENQEFIIETQFTPDYDYDGDLHCPDKKTENKNINDVTNDIVKEIIKCEKNDLYYKDSIHNIVVFTQNVIAFLQREISSQKGFFEQFNNLLGEGEYHNSKIQTKESYEEKQRIAKRRQLEETASAFVSEYKLEAIDTFESMKILHALINQQNSRREQFFSEESKTERYATYSMSGCRHTFWEDEDYARNEFDTNLDKLYDLICYVRDHFPLFWAEYQNNIKD